jgi:hypothetical protein
MAVKGNSDRSPAWRPELLCVLASLAALATMAGTCRPEPPHRSAASDGPANPPEDASVRFEIEVPPTARTGEPVPITLRVRNPGKGPRELYLAGRPTAFDITVTRTDGSVVWRRLEGATIPGILGIQVLAPGGMLEFKDTWDQRTQSGEQAGPGLYTVEGALLTDTPTPLRTGPASLRLSSQ